MTMKGITGNVRVWAVPPGSSISRSVPVSEVKKGYLVRVFQKDGKPWYVRVRKVVKRKEDIYEFEIPTAIGSLLVKGSKSLPWVKKKDGTIYEKGNFPNHLAKVLGVKKRSVGRKGFVYNFVLERNNVTIDSDSILIKPLTE